MHLPPPCFSTSVCVCAKNTDRAQGLTWRFQRQSHPQCDGAPSEGSVVLTSRDYRDPPRIDLNYFSDPYDIRILLKAMRFTRRFIQTAGFQSLCKTEIHPRPHVESDDEWMGYIRSVCETVYHPCGTAAICSVVSPDLRVHDMKNLIVANASLFPSLITANINCAVMGAAEKTG
jgi:choline dehydrogenase-like flavoprotein